jgi:hypothetical protein
LYVSNIKKALREAYGQRRHNNNNDERQFHQQNDNLQHNFRNRRGGRGYSSGRNNWSGRGSTGRGFRGRGNHSRDGGGGGRGGRDFDFQNEFEKFKLEIINIVGNR